MPTVKPQALKSKLRALTRNYELELDEICKIVFEKGYYTIGVQLPEGLKLYAEAIKDYIEERLQAQGQELAIIISGEPCYGACDLVDRQFKDFGVQCLFHFGHSELPSKKKSDIPVIYIKTPSKLELKTILNKFITYMRKHEPEFGANPKIGLISTIQHIHLINFAEKFLTGKKFKVFIGKGDKRIKYKGQVLGCNFTAAKSISKRVDLFLFIGSGNFHPLGVALDSGKKVLVADPYTNEIRDIERVRENILRQRGGAIARAMDAKSFGILLSMKSGQVRNKLALDLMNLIKQQNKKSYLIALNEFEPLKLKPYNVDTFVSTGCPRIAIDDYLKYDKPILTPIELEIVLGEKSWENYQFDQILEN
ncbi:MAG: diphthamide biosynthesis enzyme Dph2 [Thermoplasmata archaeon]|nr:diphthamide biosynthesis enzyme Dph2 [Thermoplasmata archaeon]